MSRLTVFLQNKLFSVHSCFDNSGPLQTLTLIMSDSKTRAGYTLPVFACAAAIAALRWLQNGTVQEQVTFDLVKPAESATLPIESVAGLKPGMALAITRSDPGDNLDLTRHTPIWAVVEWAASSQSEAVRLVGGEGIGIQTHGEQAPAIYAYAQRLMQTNLKALLAPSDRIQVTIILPEGRRLAVRTSNAAFGVVEGLSLLGTAGIAQPLSAPQQLEVFRADLRDRTASTAHLVFCIGENGLDLARQLGIPKGAVVKTANWIGPLLVEASLQGFATILLLGYHGKLIKLAGGIFHTHHHVADGRQEILTAHCAQVGLPAPALQKMLHQPTTEAGLAYLRTLTDASGQPWATRVYASIAAAIDQRSQAYIRTHTERTVAVGCALFDRDRQIFALSSVGRSLLDQWVT